VSRGARPLSQVDRGRGTATLVALHNINPGAPSPRPGWMERGRERGRGVERTAPLHNHAGEKLLFPYGNGFTAQCRREGEAAAREASEGSDAPTKRGRGRPKKRVRDSLTGQYK
jgi:hypothetical protein